MDPQKVFSLHLGREPGCRFATLFGASIPLTGNSFPETSPQASAKGVRPLIVSAANGFQHLNDGMEILKSGGDTLDAVLAVVTKVEDDPNDDSVGYGGLPNEDGVVELDASRDARSLAPRWCRCLHPKNKKPIARCKNSDGENQSRPHRGPRRGKIRCR